MNSMTPLFLKHRWREEFCISVIRLVQCIKLNKKSDRNVIYLGTGCVKARFITIQSIVISWPLMKRLQINKIDSMIHKYIYNYYTDKIIFLLLENVQQFYDKCIGFLTEIEFLYQPKKIFTCIFKYYLKIKWYILIPSRIINKNTHYGTVGAPAFSWFRVFEVFSPPYLIARSSTS